MLSPYIIAPASIDEKQSHTNTSENVCSRVHAHAVDACTLAELRREVHTRIVLSVAHIRQLVALEDGR